MRACITAAVVTVAGWCLAAEPKDEAAATKADREKMQGTWSVQSMETDGKREAADALKNQKAEFKDNEVFFKGGKQDYKGVFTLDATQKPKAMDTAMTFSPTKLVKTKGIYQLEGDTLTIAWTEEPNAIRPKEFVSAANSGVRMIVLKKLQQ